MDKSTLRFELMMSPTGKGYQPRELTVRVTIGVRGRHCRACSTIIPKGTKHLEIDANLSSGWRSSIKLCHHCLVGFADASG